MTMKRQLDRIIKQSKELHENITIRKYRDNFRIGFCSRCGACCRYVYLKTRLSDSILPWIEMRHIQIKKIYEDKYTIVNPMGESKTGRSEYLSLIAIPIACSQLCDYGPREGSTTCQIYGTDLMPNICSHYPISPNDFETCTYMFVDESSLESIYHLIKPFL